jgi:hypothetical protein
MDSGQSPSTEFTDRGRQNVIGSAVLTVLTLLPVLPVVAELSDQSPEPALVQHLIKTKSVRKQTRGLGAQKQPFDVNIAFRNIGRHDQEAQPIHAALKPAIGLFAWDHDLPYHSLHTCANRLFATGAGLSVFSDEFSAQVVAVARLNLRMCV